MEFALVLPALVLVLGAIIDFGFIFSQQIQMNTAARDAARAGVVSANLSGTGITCSEVANRGRNGSAGAVGLSPTSVGVSVVGPGASCTLAAGSGSAGGSASGKPCAGSASAGTTSLAVTLTYASSPPFPVPFLGTMNLTAKGDFQCEYT